MQNVDWKLSVMQILRFRDELNPRIRDENQQINCFR